jgi:hypothetical protein
MIAYVCHECSLITKQLLVRVVCVKMKYIHLQSNVDLWCYDLLKDE